MAAVEFGVSLLHLIYYHQLLQLFMIRLRDAGNALPLFYLCPRVGHVVVVSNWRFVTHVGWKTMHELSARRFRKLGTPDTIPIMEPSVLKRLNSSV